MLEEEVAVVVTERIVDLLEAVEVHQQDRRRHPLPRDTSDGLAHPPSEELAVGKRGQGVVQRLVLALGRLAAQLIEQAPVLERDGGVVGEGVAKVGGWAVARAAPAPGGGPSGM